MYELQLIIRIINCNLLQFIFYLRFIMNQAPKAVDSTLIALATASKSLEIFNPLMAIGNYSCQFNICCPRDCVSRTANVERTGRQGRTQDFVKGGAQV